MNRSLPKHKNRSLILIGILCCVLFGGTHTQTAHAETFTERLKAKGELMPFPEAKPFLTEIATVIDSPALKTAIKDSRTLQMLRERVRTSLFHLNFEFQVENGKYPYKPPFEAPFPFRPTLEVMEEAERFLENVEKSTGFKSGLPEKIAKFPYFAALKTLVPLAKSQSNVVAMTKEKIAEQPVDAYIAFQERIRTHGEIASFPEFAESVEGLLKEFGSAEINEFRQKDPAFDALCAHAIKELQSVQRPEGNTGTKLQGAHSAPYPYRKTIQAVEHAVMVFDVRERLKYPEGINWHDVEVSWFVGESKKLLPLYHFNRYKYQMAGLLADPEVVLWPHYGGSSFEFLTRLRSAPFGVIEVTTETSRIDRHHNSPIDNWFHDANHCRRMWGYDQLKQKIRNAVTQAQKIAIYREQDEFTRKLLKETEFRSIKDDPKERAIRQIQQLLYFETIHETALTPDFESLLYDLLREPATRQPFEVQLPKPIGDIEAIREFDGNLASGADKLALDLSRPMTIRYFWDRAPGFLANVHNKLGWGFFDSVFQLKNYVVSPKYRHPIYVAEAADRLFRFLNHANPISKPEMVKQMTDHSGQPELWNYFGLRDINIVRNSRLNPLYVTAGRQIHENWRLNSLYAERWKPTNAKLIDGTIVQDDWSLNRYYDERGIPTYLRKFYRIESDPVRGGRILYEDVRNLPDEYLANNHQSENLMSGAKAVTTVDRLWQKEYKFRDLDSVERWLVIASQIVHQAVLDRNANGARNNPVYNQHWLSLPSQNQLNDLELIRISFEARLKIPDKQLPPETITIFREGIARLYGKIRRGEKITACAFLMGSVVPITEVR